MGMGTAGGANGANLYLWRSGTGTLPSAELNVGPGSYDFGFSAEDGGRLDPDQTFNDGGVSFNYTVTVGPLSPFDAWALGHRLDGGPGKAAGPNDDPDHDGLPNMFEYIHGGDPLVNSHGAVATVSPANLVFTFTRDDASAASTTLVAQWGSDLSGWNDVVIGAASTPADANGVTVTITENGTAPDSVLVAIPRSNATQGALFARLKATLN